MTIAWTHPSSGSLAAFAFAREVGRTLLLHSAGQQVILDRLGRTVVKSRLTQAVAAATIADTGQVWATLDRTSRVTWFDANGTTVWSRRWPGRPAALQLDPLGEVLAIADAGAIDFFRPDGQHWHRATTPRPPLAMQFIPGKRQLIARSASTLDLWDLDARRWSSLAAGRLTDFAVTTDGRCLVAEFGVGVRLIGDSPQPWPASDSPRAIRCDLWGQLAVVVGMRPGLAVHRFDGTPLGTLPCPAAVQELAIDAAGTLAVAALADGRTLGFRLDAAISSGLR